MKVPDPIFLLNQSYESKHGNISLFYDAHFSLKDKKWNYFQKEYDYPFPEDWLTDLIPNKEILRVKNQEGK